MRYREHGVYTSAETNNPIDFPGGEDSIQFSNPRDRGAVWGEREGGRGGGGPGVADADAAADLLRLVVGLLVHVESRAHRTMAGIESATGGTLRGGGREGNAIRMRLMLKNDQTMQTNIRGMGMKNYPDMGCKSGARADFKDGINLASCE